MNNENQPSKKALVVLESWDLAVSDTSSAEPARARSSSR